MINLRILAKVTETAFVIGLSSVFSQGIAHAQVAGDVNTDQMVQRGQYLATAADCIACHTAPKGGQAFAGGYGIDSPLGTIYSTNITPSKVAGIGNYSEADFAKAVREGVTPDGTHLYPAMPYASYANMTDADVADLYAYFMHAVKPVDEKPKETALPFPFNIRASMAVWNMMFAGKHPVVLSDDANEELKRGEYLVNTLEHCAECHTPRNVAMGIDWSKNLSGGEVGSWYAPNITSDKASGIGNWTQEQLVQYLRTGSVPGLAQAAGPMAEAVSNSLQHLSDKDLNSIAAYLKSTKPIASAEQSSRANQGQPHSDDNQVRGMNVASGEAVDQGSVGAIIYSGSCAACHRPNGDGTETYPQLYHNTATGAVNPNNLISTILYGVDRNVGDKHVLMPGFGPDAYVNQLSYQEVADVTNYVLKSYGNSSVTVTAKDVETVAHGGPAPAIASLGKFAVPAIVVIVLILLILIGFFMKRRKSH